MHFYVNLAAMHEQVSCTKLSTITVSRGKQKKYYNPPERLPDDKNKRMPNANIYECNEYEFETARPEGMSVQICVFDNVLIQARCDQLSNL